MRASRAVRKIDRSLLSSQATRNLATTPAIRPSIVARARNNRPEFEFTRRGLTCTSRAGASTSSSHQNEESHKEETVGKDVEDGTPGPDLTGLPTSTDLLEVYRGMVAQGRLAYDPEQVRIVMKVRISCNESE